MDASRETAVEAQVNYLTRAAEKPVNYTFQPPPGVPWRSGTPEVHRIRVRNARMLAPPASLDIQGFALVEHRTAVEDFHDATEVHSTYYPEIDGLLKAAAGAVEVVTREQLIAEARRLRAGIRDGMHRLFSK